MDWDPEGRADVFKLDLGTDAQGNEHAIWTHVVWADPVDEREPTIMRLQN